MPIIPTFYLILVIISIFPSLNTTLLAQNESNHHTIDKPMDSHLFCNKIRKDIHQVQHLALKWEQRIKSNQKLPLYMVNALKDSTLNTLRSEGELIQQGPKIEYIKKILDHLSLGIQHKIDYDVYLLKSTRISNAFAIPPNVLVISEAFLNQLEHDTEVAFILAHELAHLYLEHSLSLVSVIYELFETVEGHDDDTFIWALIFSQFLQKLYGSQLEEQADVWALELLYLRNYDLNHITKLWHKMEDIQRNVKPKYDYQEFKQDFGEEIKALDQSKHQLVQKSLNAMNELAAQNQKIKKIRNQFEMKIKNLTNKSLKEEIKALLKTHPSRILRVCLYREISQELKKKYK